MEDRGHIIGSGDNPIYICKKREVPKLFTWTFWQIYQTWERFHWGLGLPSPVVWTDQEEDVVRIMAAMETHFDRHFSSNSVIIKYLEALLRSG